MQQRHFGHPTDCWIPVLLGSGMEPGVELGEKRVVWDVSVEK